MSLQARLEANLLRLAQAKPQMLPCGRLTSEAALNAQRRVDTSAKREGVTAFAAFARLAASPRLSPALAAALDDDHDALLHWYLAAYAPAMLPSRAPLSSGDISYLQSSDPLRISDGELPRIVTWELLLGAAPKAVGTVATGFTRSALAYWWACERAPSMGIEDCLVPDVFVADLSAPDATSGRPTVLERLLEHRDADLADLHRTGAPRGVIDAYLALLVVERPGLLRFCVPPAAAEPAFFRPLLETAGGPAVEAARLSGLVRVACEAAGFDTERGVYRTRDSQGQRGFAVTERRASDGAPALMRIGADVEIVGPLSLRSGLGQAARRSVETFEKAGVKVKATDFTAGFPSPTEPFAPSPSIEGEAGATVFHLNPDMLPRAFAFGPGGHARRRAGYFFWELDAPASCDFLAFDLVNAIWTASRFVQGVYAPSFGGPVEHVGLALPPVTTPDRGAAGAALRERLGLAPSTFVAVSVFDGLSYAGRKNPDGAIRAFRQAFKSAGDAALLLKVHNRPAAGTAGAQGNIWDEVAAAAAEDPRIRIDDETTSHARILEVIAGADIFLSLHRSEGFGLGPAEAMQVGTPVLVTAYGGTEDFCDDATAFRVPYRKIAVGPGDYVHAEPGHGWADPDIRAAGEILRAAADHPALRGAKAGAARRQIETAFSFEAVGARYVAALERLLSSP